MSPLVAAGRAAGRAAAAVAPPPPTTPPPQEALARALESGKRALPARSRRDWDRTMSIRLVVKICVPLLTEPSTYA